MTNEELAQRYIDSIALLSDRSIVGRKAFFMKFAKEFPKSFLEATPADLRKYIISKKESRSWNKPGTIACAITYLRTFFKFLIDEKYFPSQDNPAVLIKKPAARPEGELRTLNVDEIRKLLKGAESPMIEAKTRLLFYLAMTSGLRANEICRIKKVCIDLDKRLIYIPKDSVKGRYREKLVPISNKTKDLIEIYLSKYPNNSEFLFNNRFGKMIAPHAVWRAMKEVIDTAYIYKDSWSKPYGPHIARHTFASRWIESGGDWHALRAIMGWKSFQQFDRYVNVSPEFISKAAHKVERKLLKV